MMTTNFYPVEVLKNRKYINVQLHQGQSAVLCLCEPLLLIEVS